jgi:hypothetical protein
MLSHIITQYSISVLDSLNLENFHMANRNTTTLAHMYERYHLLVSFSLHLDELAKLM